jgi:hypothetical protein
LKAEVVKNAILEDEASSRGGDHRDFLRFAEPLWRSLPEALVLVASNAFVTSGPLM